MKDTTLTFTAMKDTTLFDEQDATVIRHAYRLQHHFLEPATPTFLAQCVLHAATSQAFWIITDYRAALRAIDTAVYTVHQLSSRLYDTHKLMQPLLDLGLTLQFTRGSAISEQLSIILQLAFIAAETRGESYETPDFSGGEVSPREFQRVHGDVNDALMMLYDIQARVAIAEERVRGDGGRPTPAAPQPPTVKPPRGASEAKRQEAAAWE